MWRSNSFSTGGRGRTPNNFDLPNFGWFIYRQASLIKGSIYLQWKEKTSLLFFVTESIFVGISVTHKLLSKRPSYVSNMILYDFFFKWKQILSGIWNELLLSAILRYLIFSLTGKFISFLIIN